MNITTFISAIVVALASFAAAAPIADGETGSGTPVSLVFHLDGHFPCHHRILEKDEPYLSYLL